jgi:hypothetical protein
MQTNASAGNRNRRAQHAAQVCSLMQICGRQQPAVTGFRHDSLGDRLKSVFASENTIAAIRLARKPAFNGYATSMQITR